MSKRSQRALPEPIPEETFERGSDGYNHAAQDMMDEAQWRGTGQPALPDKVIEHYFPDEEDVKHVYKKKER